MFRITILVVALCLASGAHIPARIHNGRIVGGKPTTIEKFPYQVSLHQYGSFYCGGSIISANVILTAGHCASHLSARSLTVRVGSNATDEGGVVHKVSEVVPHKGSGYNGYGVPVNDIAIMKLEKPIEFDEATQPIGLFEKGKETSEGVPATVSGWGTLSESGSLPEVLYSVDMPIISKSDCSKSLKKYGGLPANQICAGVPKGGKDACQGDSGGPLVVDGKQAGIVSWGYGCARPNYPGAYTEVASYRDWLLEHADI